ncbi:unnamed protein product [Dovyalis caffra]|uniref:NAC domain-containing protein n=1 Tax=Dovyalis caffra TaxID=77055 RepID=A0AAV1RPS7_9ROSI|nr:unnamed protein product [Dovyalis caffra]
MSPTTSRTNCLVGSSDGTWHDEGRNKRSGWLGIRWLVKIFNYKNPKSKAHNGAWMMHEYNLVANDIKQPKRKRRLDDEEEGDDGMDKNSKRSMGDQLAISTIARFVNATTNNNGDEHRSLDGADAPEDQPLLTDDAYSFGADDILSTEPFDSNGALRQRRIVGNGEEMALDNDYFHSVVQELLCEEAIASCNSEMRLQSVDSLGFVELVD